MIGLPVTKLLIQSTLCPLKADCKSVEWQTSYKLCDEDKRIFEVSFECPGISQNVFYDTFHVQNNTLY